MTRISFTEKSNIIRRVADLLLGPPTGTVEARPQNTWKPQLYQNELDKHGHLNILLNE